MLGHKTTLNTFKKTEIISSIFSDHNGMNLEINYTKKAGENNKNVENEQHTTEQLLGP